MPPCPRSKTDPVAAHKDANGWWHFMCPVCCVSTPRVSRYYDQGLFNFWKEHDFRNKEKPMLSEYEHGYKAGVEAGTAAFGSEHLFPGTFWKVHTPGCDLWGEPLGVRIEQLLKERRKKLLTKKVTKWINIWKTGPSVSDPASVRFGTGILYNDKPTAEANVLDPSREYFLGTYPIEIETEI